MPPCGLGFRQRVLLHGAEPGLVDELIEPFRRRRGGLRRGVEIGFDFRGGEQIFKADAGRLRRLADRPGHLWCAGSSRMNGHRVGPCEDLVLWVMTRTQTFPASLPSMGELW